MKHKNKQTQLDDFDNINARDYISLTKVQISLSDIGVAIFGKNFMASLSKDLFKDIVKCLTDLDPGTPIEVELPFVRIDDSGRPIKNEQTV